MTVAVKIPTWMGPPKQPNKYFAKKAVHAGKLYDSQKEGNYAHELDLRVKAGELAGWERQIPFRLPRDPNKKKLNVIKPDFCEIYPDGHRKYVEVKGRPTREWQVKWNWFRSEYPELDVQVV